MGCMSNVVDISGRLPRKARRAKLPRVYKPWMLKHLVPTIESDDEPGLRAITEQFAARGEHIEFRKLAE